MDFPVKQINWVDCHQLSKYFFEQYHIEVDVLQLVSDLWDNTHGNGSYATFDVGQEGPESCWEIENWTSEIGIDLIERWRKSDLETDIELLLWHQWYLGNIPEGEYYIDLWW